ncbi:MAG: glucose-6-phosphate isomerase [FCB group bacterium]|nr:glucose-6-phosphate isomerase [FCB group bacterium]MBL7029000.1 glucose-6-phosphate isomerase [Candidatus Neomarinimicrobiota bacterium]MBL7122531.1 glucose-6-phosphate isomerase [Candidatus Neomarinimicrobiota bacterium]
MPTSSTLKSYSDKLYTNETLDFYLDLNDADLTETSIISLQPALIQALNEMQNLENGAIANPDENRTVGHYWLRNHTLAPLSEIRTQIEETINSIKSFAATVHQGQLLNPHGLAFSNILLIGIGGSALGPQFIADALDPKTAMNIHFLDNTDPDGIDRVLSGLSGVLSETLVIVISKSGGTAETRNGMLETQNVFTNQGLDFGRQAIAITGQDSQLYKLASEDNWLSIFPMWDWVGGRTSVMSAVGLLPAALLGIDIDALLAGAATMDEVTRSSDISKNPAALLAQAWFILGDGKGSKDMVVLPYKDRLLLFSRYLQQLIMESLGKRLDTQGNIVNQGLAVYGNKGSTDQHAYVQQLRDGLNNFFVTFIEVLSDREGSSILVDGQNSSGDYLFGFYKGTQTALSSSNRKSITITIPDVSPRSIGALIALYERAVGLYATLININAYHQPGVEAGKKAAGNVLDIKNSLLELLSGSDEYLSIEDISDQLSLAGQEILLYHILRHHAANHELDIMGSLMDPTSVKVKLR